MAGTRYILAGYLKTLGLSSGEIKYLISDLVQSPGYPSNQTIEDCFRRFGLELSAVCVDQADLIALNTIALSQVIHTSAEYILLLKIETNKAICLNGMGEINSFSIEEFVSIWPGKIFVATGFSTDLFRARITEMQNANTPKNRVHLSIADIKESSHLNEPLVYRGCRRISVYLSYLFIRLHLHPDVITFSWLFPIVIAALLLAEGSTMTVRVASIALILLGYTLDCSDGEVARMTGQYSRIGGYLDVLIHWISGPILIFGVTMGIYRNTQDNGILLTGLKAIFGGTLYNYMSIQLNSWRGHNNPYAVQHPLLLPLFWLFPLDLNIFLIGTLLNMLPESLRLWEMLSYILTLIIVGVFFLNEAWPTRRP